MQKCLVESKGWKIRAIDLQVNSCRAKEGFMEETLLIGRNPFEKGFPHLPKTFNILLQRNFRRSIEIRVSEVIEAMGANELDIRYVYERNC